ncbi:hypothetical protein MUP56_03085, partial [Patescibacteria group bacterium]|nr:hypothetical protein [Patescibacteria group bacterium]
GPGELTYTQFGSDISLIAGGNTGSCDVNASVLPANGVYNFKAIAQAGAETAESEIISLNFSSGNPGDPTDYSKDHISSCQYKIHFKTADDGGKTTSVEIYRSENTSFTADSGSRVATIAVGSNEVRDYIDNVTCDKTYYYAVRAFDIGGNGSNVVGDSVINVTYTTTTTTVITTVTGGTTTTGGVAAAPAAAIVVPGGAGLPAEGAVPAEGGAALGETTTGQPTPEQITLPPEGQVKGAKTTIFTKPVILTICGILLGIAFAIWYASRKKIQKEHTPKTK